MKIFYHNDLDGKCAAHIVLWKDPDAEEGTCTLAMQYGDEFPFEHIGKNEKVYILDYSIEPEEMKRLRRITTFVVWIDHHQTALEKYLGFPADIDGVRSVEASGCELTWEYFMGTLITPKYIQLIGDRDTWTWKYGDRTKFFFAGMLGREVHPAANIWVDLANDTRDFDVLTSVQGDGQIIDGYRARTHQEALADTGFWVQFHDYNCYAVNGRFDSKPFEANYPEADVWLTFRYIGKSKCWMVSLYSDKVDVSEIAKQYEYYGKKGGGHKGAAGFECDYPPFLPGILDIETAEESIDESE